MEAHGSIASISQPRETLVPPGALEAQAQVERARQLFQRSLACWAQDCLELRRTGVLGAKWGIAAAGRRAA